MTFTQAPIGWNKDKHGLNINIPEPGTRGSEVVETINEAVLDNTWRQLPQDIRDAIKLGAELGWESGSTMPDGSPNPIQVQDLEPLLNLSPAVLKYKAIRAGISRGLGFDPRLVDQAALSIGGLNLLKSGIKKTIPTVKGGVESAQQRVGLKPRIYKGDTSGSIPMEPLTKQYEAIINDAFNQRTLSQYTYGSALKEMPFLLGGKSATSPGYALAMGRRLPKFEYQGSFMFDKDGNVHWNKIDPKSKDAWRYWLHLTARNSGYDSMKEMRKLMLDWPDKDYQNFLKELWYGSTEGGTEINPFNYVGYAEHKIAKASKKDRRDEIKRKNPGLHYKRVAAKLAKKSSKTYDMDWLHDTEWIDHTGTLRTDGIGLGDRNAPKNMLALFNSRWKSLKDVVERIGYGEERAPGPLFSFSDGTWRNPNQRFYVDVEDPGKSGKQYLRQNPGDVVIKRASNHKIVGNLGSYLDALYPKDKGLQIKLEVSVPKTINPSTGKFFSSLAEFREYIILERINIIIRDTNTLPSNLTKRKRYIKEQIQLDMDRLFDQYPFLRPTKSLADEIAEDPYLSEEGYLKRGQGKNPRPPLGSIPVKKGPWAGLTKTLEQKTTKFKGTGRVDFEDLPDYDNIVEDAWDDK